MRLWGGGRPRPPIPSVITGEGVETELRELLPRHDGCNRSLFERLRHKVMPIHFLAFDREEEFSWTNRARINRIARGYGVRIKIARIYAYEFRYSRKRQLHTGRSTVMLRS